MLALGSTLDRLGGGVSAALLGSLGLGIVGDAVKVDEEQEVGRQEAASKEGSSLSSSALASVGSPGEVGEREVGVGAEVDEAQIEDKLDDLHGGEVLLPPDTDTGGRAHVVVVHHNVDSQVQGDGDPGDRGISSELDVAKDHGHRVMEIVQEFYDSSQQRVSSVSTECRSWSACVIWWRIPAQSKDPFPCAHILWVAML